MKNALDEDPEYFFSISAEIRVDIEFEEPALQEEL